MKTFKEIERQFRYPSASIDVMDALSELLDEKESQADTSALSTKEAAKEVTRQALESVILLVGMDAFVLSKDTDHERVIDYCGEALLDFLDDENFTDDEVEAILGEIKARCFEGLARHERMQELVPDAQTAIVAYLKTAVYRYPSADLAETQLLLKHISIALDDSQMDNDVRTLSVAYYVSIGERLERLGVLEVGDELPEAAYAEAACKCLLFFLENEKTQRVAPELCEEAADFLERAKQLPEENPDI